MIRPLFWPSVSPHRRTQPLPVAVTACRAHVSALMGEASTSSLREPWSLWQGHKNEAWEQTGARLDPEPSVASSTLHMGMANTAHPPSLSDLGFADRVGPGARRLNASPGAMTHQIGTRRPGSQPTSHLLTVALPCFQASGTGSVQKGPHYISVQSLHTPPSGAQRRERKCSGMTCCA